MCACYVSNKKPGTLRYDCFDGPLITCASTNGIHALAQALGTGPSLWPGLFGREFCLSCVEAPSPEEMGEFSCTRHRLPLCASLPLAQPPPVTCLDFARLLSPWGETEQILIFNTPFSAFWGRTYCQGC